MCPLKKNKTLFCKHKKSCIQSLIIGFIKGFSKFFTIQLILNFISFHKEYYYNQNSIKNIFPNIFKKNVLSVLGSEDTGNYQIVVFAVNYCRERNIIHEAIYFDLSRLNLLDMMDRLNILLALDVSTSTTRKKYIQNLIEKMNEKFSKNPLPVTLIFDNLDNLNNKHP